MSAELDKVVVEAARKITSAIEAESPETDCRLLPRKMKELISSTLSAQSSSLVTIVANDVMPKLNIAADVLACAHAMYTVGDKTNALRMAMVAFESPDCVPLMISLSELNEETDPSDIKDVVARINKGEADDRDIVDHDPDEILYGDDLPPVDVAPKSASDDALTGNPAVGIDAIQDQDLNDPHSGSPYGDFADYDFLNQGTPPDSIQVLRDVLSENYDYDSEDWEAVIAAEKSLEWKTVEKPYGTWAQTEHNGHIAKVLRQGDGYADTPKYLCRIIDPNAASDSRYRDIDLPKGKGKLVHESRHINGFVAKRHAEEYLKGLGNVKASGNMTNLSEDLGDEDYGGNNNVTDSGYSDNYSFEDEGNDVTARTEPKFKAGDKVKLRPSFAGDNKPNEIFTIAKTYNGSKHKLLNKEGRDWYAHDNMLVSAMYEDVVPGYDDNQLSNVRTDPATDIEWNPANWDLDDDMPTRSDPMTMDFDDMAAVNPGMTDLNGIDNTAEGNPRNSSDTSALDQQFGLIPSLNPSQSIIAKIKDSRVLAAINIMSAKTDEDSKAKLAGFINLYFLKNNLE